MTARAPRTVLAVTTVLATAAAGATALIGAAPSIAAAPKISITTVISGLNNPRGITFDGRGNLYVAESGTAGTGPAGVNHSGRVTKYRHGTTKAVWSKRFEALWASEDPSAPPDLLGPEGLSALQQGCKKWDGNGRRATWVRQCQVRVILSASHRLVAANTGGAVSTSQLGHLYRLKAGTGHRRDLRNVGDWSYGWSNRHKKLFPDDFPDANPFGVLVIRDESSGRLRTFIAEAAVNIIAEVLPNGRQRVVSYIPNETEPPFRDATPTCIAEGPDGMLYVATLNLVANVFVPGATGGKSNVWRVDPNAKYPTKPTLWATGLTTPTGCLFDQAGNFWATELFAPNASGPPGDVVRIPFAHPKRLHRYGGGSLPMPGMLAQAPGGALFITTHAADPTPGSGEVVKLRIRP